MITVKPSSSLLPVRPASASLSVRPDSALLAVRPESSLLASQHPPSSQNFDWESTRSSASNVGGSRSKVKQERLEPQPVAPLINVKKERFESYQEEIGEQAEEEEGYDDLTVDELVSLFQNFKELDKENQEQLIIYMKKLETSNPDKVALIKFKIQGI